MKPHEYKEKLPQEISRERITEITDRRDNAYRVGSSTAVRRVYQALLHMQINMQRDGDDDAETILCDEILDGFYENNREGLKVW